ncbi:MAG: 16S rRNA (cytosine(1402)-N(4))-methyltransferase RsmH [Parachlamydiaceae bacterium]|nr:16S rRNA (cytosine(1402)-N(4))-methyltransferase RsmH [Parachlamydiaceae bacterium]
MNPSTSHPHVSVLLEEVLQTFESTHLICFVDGTLGAGGHAEAILAAHPEIKFYLGIDQDAQALELAAARLKPWADKLILKQGNFADFDLFLKELQLPNPNGFLVDLGVSSMQLDQAARGFSFSKEGPLDMRMNQEIGHTAADIVNNATEYELGKIFREYGEEKRWRNAARTIVEARQKNPILTTTDLANVLRPALPWNPKKGINPLTLIFQALRISVNKELEVLEIFVTKAIDVLLPNGRLAVISFHSLEDRIVKNQMRFAASDKFETTGLGGIFRDKKPIVSLTTKKPIGPTDDEVDKNPRSRSAKLRVVEKLPD